MLEVLTSLVEQEKTTQKFGKEETKLTLFIVDKIIYIEIQRGSTNKLLEFSKVSGFKVNYKKINLISTH